MARKKKGGQPSPKVNKKFSLTDAQQADLLLKGSYIKEEDLKKAQAESKRTKVSLIDYFLSQELITKDLLGQAIAEFLGIPYADLNTNQPSAEKLDKIPAELAKRYRAVVFDMNDKGSVVIATDNPTRSGMAASLKAATKAKKLTLAYSLPEDLDNVLLNYRASLKTRFSKIISGEEKIAPNIIYEIVDDALAYRASDIHFEPQRDQAIVRFRIDGILQEAGQIPLLNYESILNRIKVQANMRIDEHLSTQDGSIRLEVSGKTADMRISIVPTIMGEKIVIRLLAQYVSSFSLGNLGLSEYNEKLLAESSAKPFGMILVTGPTGSGKTTTLYSLLRILHQPGVNITTIEDPVEYRIVGVNQIQVNKQTELTFARGLRSIVRQDPDIILVGEVRDEETAEIAVNAALTGHLLLSTFHANDAATTIPRLLDMGIEPFLLSSTLELVIAQRLVRKICDHCRYSTTVSKSAIEKQYSGSGKHFTKSKLTLYEGKGCPTCAHTGYQGRTAIFEFINVDKEMKELILKNPSAREVWQLAKKKGSKSLFEDGIVKVKNGITTMAELMRVAKPE